MYSVSHCINVENFLDFEYSFLDLPFSADLEGNIELWFFSKPQLNAQSILLLSFLCTYIKFYRYSCEVIFLTILEMALLYKRAPVPTRILSALILCRPRKC